MSDPRPSTPEQPGRVSDAQDVLDCARWFAALVLTGTPRALQNPAGDVAWSCWRTAEHVADDMLAYALQLAALPRLAYVPLVAADGGDDLVRVDPASGTAGLAEAVTGTAALLAAQVASADPAARAFHPSGLSDPAGFAAMGVVELLVHGYDVAAGLGVDVSTPAGRTVHSMPSGPAGRAVSRLFDDAPTTSRPETALLWCTGRIALPGIPRRTRWRWDASVR